MKIRNQCPTCGYPRREHRPASVIAAECRARGDAAFINAPSDFITKIEAEIDEPDMEAVQHLSPEIKAYCAMLISDVVLAETNGIKLQIDAVKQRMDTTLEQITEAADEGAVSKDEARQIALAAASEHCGWDAKSEIRKLVKWRERMLKIFGGGDDDEYDDY